MFQDTRKNSDVSRILITTALLATLGLAGCAGAGVPSTAREVDRPPTRSVFATVEAAAADALGALRDDRNPATRGRFRVGRILAVAGGYTWEAPVAAAPGPRPVVRLASGPDHVATYMARETRLSGSRAQLERHHQRLERALVERRDARHRPLYVLTADGEVLAYQGRFDRERLPAFAASD